MMQQYFTNLARAIAQVPNDRAEAVLDALWQTYLRDGTVIVCGNGGSAATASHLVCDLGKWTVVAGQRRFRAVALTDNMPLVTAWGNDTAYERVFVEQIPMIYRPGDLLVTISGSGNSPNVLHVSEWVQAQGGQVVGLSGFGGGKLASLADISFVAPSSFMPEVEDIHMALCHALAVNLAERIRAV
ncbi:MAG: SIS domain-containing protein [Chloroflexales bacterium]|jgi:D-sedoheptulose 7-phosphate isomerase|nr:SIS domain-containing protein [Chloroflexales bacterium]